MADVKYINSANKTIALSTYPIRLKQKSAGLHSFEYEVDDTDLGTGSRVNAIERKAREYEMEIDFSGARAERAGLLQSFFEITDYDVVNLSPGRLYVNTQYIECFVISSEAQTYDDRYRTVGKKCTLYVPYPYWMEEVTYQYFKKDESEVDFEYLEFPYDHPYDYTAGQIGTATLNNTHYVPSGFKIIIYGPCVNPYVIIGDHTYRMNSVLDNNEYLVIDSRENKIYRVKNNGETINEYNNRDKGTSIFEKIPPGMQSVAWPGTFGFDVILYQERSELRWN